MESRTTGNSRHMLISKVVGFSLDNIGADNRLGAEVKNAIVIGLHMLNNAGVGEIVDREMAIKAVLDAFCIADEKLALQVRDIFAEVIDPIMLELRSLDLRRMKRIDFDMSFIISDYIKPSVASIMRIMDRGDVRIDANVRDGIVYPVIVIPIVKSMHNNLKFYSAFVDELVRREEDEGSKALIKALTLRS
ncbi:MAG: hypothetical protein M1279_00045 [Candidatus Marsarchaeota archaeon]|nr:hypothetical protein [Candidatus Marsarchaeota archaeon]